MVAAHADDLRAARAAGLRTAFLPRPLEHGPDGKGERGAPDDWPGEWPGDWDVVAEDMIDPGRARAPGLTPPPAAPLRPPFR